MGVDRVALGPLVLWDPYRGRLGCSGASPGVDWGALGGSRAPMGVDWERNKASKTQEKIGLHMDI